MSLPERLGRLRRVERLGAGAFATVWLYHDDDLDSPVAVKALADNWAQRLDVRERFVEEARILRRADADHVVRVYDIGDHEQTPYFVMTYADRGTLADLLEPGVPLDPARVVDLITQAGAGVAALHRSGVIHRDLAPRNLLLASAPGGGEQVLVADLGLAKAIAQASGLTQVVGTPAYMAPEQARGEGLDLRADVHALAAVAYHLLTGRPVREGGLAALGAPVLPPPPSRLVTVPPAVDDVLLRALAIDPADRWPDVPTFVAALQRALAGPAAAPAGESRSGARTAVLALLVLAVAFGAGLGAVRLLADDAPARPSSAASTPSRPSSPPSSAPATGGSDAPAASTSPTSPTSAPAADIDYPALTAAIARTASASHTVSADGRRWTYQAPADWAASAVSADSGDAGLLTGAAVDRQAQVRWRPADEPAVGGYNLRVRVLPAAGDPAGDPAGDAAGGVPAGATVAQAVAAKRAALLDSRDLDSVDVFRTTDDAVYFSYLDARGRLRLNFFRWVAGGDGTASFEVSVSGRRADRAGLDALLGAVAGSARQA
ncbi:serine/threonine-protein kinase [Nocardioides sp.]|uniref:serine/threonine-protein kinase n=1 Tax=Nocardioides sp. TaxID=35761 RepID=UPI0035144226